MAVHLVPLPALLCNAAGFLSEGNDLQGRKNVCPDMQLRHFLQGRMQASRLASQPAPVVLTGTTTGICLHTALLLLHQVLQSMEPCCEDRIIQLDTWREGTLTATGRYRDSKDTASSTGVIQDTGN